MKKSKPSFLSRLDRIPPCVCRLVARSHNGRHMLGCREIAELSGISKSFIAELSLRTTWAKVDAATIDRFTKACGVDLLCPWKTITTLQRSKQLWLTRARAEQKAMLQKIFKLSPEPDM